MRIVEAVKLKSFSKLSRSSYIGDNLSALSEIFKEKINISIWQRKLDSNIRKEAEDIINLNPILGTLNQNHEKKENNLSRILVFGGSTSHGKNCSNNTSYTDFLQKDFKNLYFENVAGNGFSSEISLRWMIKKLQNNNNYMQVV